MYNDCYGGFGFSKLALDEYNKNTIFESDGYNIDRNDPIMINICKTLGSLVNTKYSCIKIKKIPIIYQHYCKIKEYDGKEIVVIDYKKYKLDCIKDIIDNEDDENSKIIKIKEILKN